MISIKENYENIKRITPSCLENAIYNYNENPLPIEKVMDSLNGKRLNAVHKALLYYIIYVQKENKINY